MLAMTLTTTCLGRIGVVEREEKGRAVEGAAVEAAKTPKAASGEQWTTVGAIAAEIVARCRAEKKRRGQHVPAPMRSGTPE